MTEPKFKIGQIVYQLSNLGYIYEFKIDRMQLAYIDQKEGHQYWLYGTWVNRSLEILEYEIYETREEATEAVKVYLEDLLAKIYREEDKPIVITWEQDKEYREKTMKRIKELGK
jgi:hypothetical protein